MMNTLFLPAVYLGGCIAAMSAFSFVYRRATMFKSMEAWFPINTQKEEYIALLNCEPAVPEYHLRAALLRRAMEAVRRLVQIQQEKPALQQLMKTGSIGDDLWHEFQAAEQEITAELQEISMEANTFKEGWSQTIFSTAAQMLEHEKQKKLQVEMKAMLEKETLRKKKEEEREATEAKMNEAKREKEAKKAEEELLRMEEEEKKAAAAAAASKKK
ncbi:Pre protein translocase subunit Sec66-domain-containing protein [Mycotypha africana]|uniref:Pre protein translocase subunit Sec66-domain-containing protein n=1 Tax=Mycotypha africana TaxID=64632 RepID=UPI002300985C|nr:Pre protein translocase subunit Sec66-domain-containing protein [Mycotypha africana]KAI8984388.1 Pre protein translocase subunit Sec66-domain-containing protein [Mycotypha africana]